MLGPLDRVKGNPRIQDSVANMKRVIEESHNKNPVDEAAPCDSIVNGAYMRLFGKNPFSPDIDKSNPFGDDSGFYLG